MQKTLPKGWKWVKLGEVCEFVRGVTFDKSEVSKEVRNNYLPVLRAGNIKSGLDTVNDLLWVTEKQISDKQKLQVGDIVVCMSSGSSDVVGKTAQLKYPFIGSFGAFCGVIRAMNKEHIDYVAYWLGSSAYYKWRDGQARGVNIQNLKFSNFETIQIPLPPLPTQHKIVEILEEADNLRKLRQQADEKMKDLIPSLFVQMFGDPAINSKKWEIKRLEEVCTKITDGSHRTPKLLDKGYPFLTVTNLQNGSFDFSDVKFISVMDYKDLIKNDCKPLKGDVLFSKDGTIGKVVEIKQEKEFVILSSLAILRPQPKIIHSTYLAKIALTDFFINQAKEKQSGSALRRIILRSLKSVKIPLPPLPLQQEFAKLVEDIEAEKARQAESKKKLDELFNSLMQRAFTGELVA